MLRDVDVHGLRAWRSGADLHVDLHLVVPHYFTARRLHDVHDAIEQRIQALDDGEGDTVVHFDPCRPEHCAGCAMPACPERTSELGQRAELTAESIARAQPEPRDPWVAR